MNDFRNGFEFLEHLKARDARNLSSFDSLKKYLCAKASRQGVPLNGIFELTPLCNFDCKMCYTHLRTDQLHGRELLTTEQWKSLMHSAWKAGMMYACLTGGECLTYPGFRELYLYLRSLGVMVTVYTNGALLDESWVRFFRDHKPVKIQITLYGGDEETYERVTGQRRFSTVTEAIRRLIEAEIPLKVVVTPSRYMGEGVFDAIRVMKSFGVPYSVNTMLFDPKEETGRSGQVHDVDTEDYARILRFLNDLKGVETREIAPEDLPPPGGPCRERGTRGMTCGAGRSSFTLEWDGAMVPCSSIREIREKPLESTFLSAWESIRRQCSQWPRTPECAGCPYQQVCISCPALKALFGEPGKQPLALCERTRTLVQRGVCIIPDCE